MRICLALLYWNGETEPPEAFLERKIIPRALSHALAARGHKVEVVVLSHSDVDFEENGVRYRFIRSGPLSRLMSSAADSLVSARYSFQPALQCVQAIKAFDPDFVHFFGSQLHLNLWMLLRALENTSARVLLHYHGGLPSRNRMGRRLQKWNFRRIDRFLFATMDHARPFLRRGMLGSEKDAVPLVTTSSTINRVPRESARVETRMTGNPVFVWTGRLHPVKDPITALLGFEKIQKENPEARLYMYYQEDTLLADVQSTITRYPSLSNSVHLRGSVPVSSMEAIYNSADFFLQASHQEVSGFAVAEAMAAGVIPIVTDIPSFRSMTDGGRFGILFPRGDVNGLVSMYKKEGERDLRSWADEIHTHFQRCLSFRAIAQRLDEVYDELLKGSR